MKLAAVQYRPPKGEPDRARADLVSLLAEAGAQGADLVVFPEMATSGYVWRSPAELAPFAEAPTGPTFQALAAGAQTHGCWVVCGFPERGAASASPTGALRARLHNSALIISPTGELVACYRKVLLYEADYDWAQPGHRRILCDTTSLGRLAPGICMDLNDHRFVTHLIADRVDVCAFCTNWVEEGIDVHAYWQDRLQRWSGWFVAANAWGEDRGTHFSGRSAILAPDGSVAAAAPEEGDRVILVDTQAASPRA